ncbi:ferredoxin-like protein [Thalictrum thalictroides]|uniref:Ferredoxin-like protein n=1 Tax=Thalictrum thalictroides TaxID=46969 RepID=A0A7J6WSR4_THATH|nr:ferredoxin-like protein [Thalictrum thalictroides]
MLVIMKKLYCCKLFILLCIVLFSTLVSAKNHENVANELVNIINENRTAQKLQKLNNNPGLGCIALQYMEECNGTCTSNGTMKCQTPEDDFTEVYAPNCGVELPTFGTLSSRIVGCHSKYLKPSEAFSQIIGRDQKTLSLVKDKKHTEVGVGLVRSHQGPFLWCVLLSNDKVNSTFVLEGGGKGIKQKRGCFSGTNTPCSRGKKIHLLLNSILTVICSIFVLYVSGIVHL